MFKRIILEEWHEGLLPYLAFGFIFIGFIVGVIWAIRMPSAEADRAARIPLDHEDETK